MLTELPSMIDIAPPYSSAYIEDVCFDTMEKMRTGYCYEMRRTPYGTLNGNQENLSQYSHTTYINTVAMI